MSSALVTDQNPSSCGYSVILSVQWTGQPWRSCLKVSCGGPSSHSSRSVTRRSFKGFASTDIALVSSYSDAGGMPKSVSVLTVRQILLLCVCALMLPSAAGARTWPARFVSINDGDTIDARVCGRVFTVRLSSMQAMEQHTYSSRPSQRTGECNAVEATTPLEH